MSIIVNAIILNNNKVLTVKQRNGIYNDMFGLPGGHVEKNETNETALIREVKEETNCEIKIIAFKGIVANNKNECYIFSAQIDKQFKFIESDEVLEIKWLAIPDFIENLKKHDVENWRLLLPMLK